MHPKVSVIMPAYNVAPYIEKSIQSVLQQSEQEFEILVVDDCSTDETAAIVRQFRDNRIRLLQNEQNRGQSYSRNRAMQAANGEWLALLDADDWWAPERLAELLALAQRTQADLVADDLLAVYSEDNDPGRSALAERGVKLREPMTISPVTFVDWDLGITQPMLRRAFWLQTELRFTETMRAGEEDFPFLLRCLLRDGKFVLTPKAYYYYRTRPGSMTSRRVYIFQKTREVARSLLNETAVQANPVLVQALYRRIRHASNVIAYTQVKEDATRVAVFAALTKICRTPTVIPFALGRMQKALLRSR